MKIDMHNDIGNARKFVKTYGDLVRYLPRHKRWFIYDGKRWTVDDMRRVQRYAQDMVLNMQLEAAGLYDAKERQAALRWAKRSADARRINALIDQASSMLSITPDTFDLHREIVNTQSGVMYIGSNSELLTLDYNHNGSMQYHDDYKSDNAELYCSKITSVEHNTDAQCPMFDAFMHTIFAERKDLIDYLWRAIGLSISGYTEAVIFICHGVGANGKSTLLDTLMAMLGDYALATTTETLLVKRSGAPTNDVARLQGARMVVAQEVGQGRNLDEQLVKQLTGGDQVTARFLYGEYFTFQPCCKIWLCTNHRPRITGTDHGIWRRIHLIPFSITIPEAEQDHQMSKKLKAELPGIFAKAVKGLKQWQEQGLNPPLEVLAATGEYRSEQDGMKAFLDDCCLLGELYRSKSQLMYNTYKAWSKQSGEKTISQRNFNATLKDRGFEHSKTNSGSWWLSVGVREDKIQEFSSSS